MPQKADVAQRYRQHPRQDSTDQRITRLLIACSRSLKQVLFLLWCQNRKRSQVFAIELVTRENVSV